MTLTVLRAVIGAARIVSKPSALKCSRSAATVTTMFLRGGKFKTSAVSGIVAVCFLFSFSGDNVNTHLRTAVDLYEHSTQNSVECELILDVNPRCVRILQYSRTSNSGFGHQLSELIQSMHISYTHAAALKFSGFGDKVSRHGHVYNFADSLLGDGIVFLMRESHLRCRFC